MDIEYLTIRQAAAYIGVSRRTLYLWIKQGKVEFIRIPSGSIRVVRASLIRPATPDHPTRLQRLPKVDKELLLADQQK